ncbi:MAG: orotate phosphoribosyltransferase [Longimicrobiales bacterium]
MDAHEQLCQLLIERSLFRGDFVLSSGKRSSHYIDARRTTMSGAGQQLIGELGLHAMEAQGWTPRAIGGLTLGADPVAYAVAHAAALRGLTLDAFTVRKEAKSHGAAGQLIEGVFESGWPVVIVEDTITTGASALRAAETVRTAGGFVLGVLAVVDREEGGTEKIAEKGLQSVALVRVSELMARP